jgi:hypothetical protein
MADDYGSVAKPCVEQSRGKSLDGFFCVENESLANSKVFDWVAGRCHLAEQDDIRTLLGSALHHVEAGV